MATCDRPTSFADLELPPEFDDLRGLIHADLRAIVRMVSQRAQDRLYLTRRESASLQTNLWNRLVDAINESVEPLSAELR
jgi:hypothetical protein